MISNLLDFINLRKHFNEQLKENHKMKLFRIGNITQPPCILVGEGCKIKYCGFLDSNIIKLKNSISGDSTFYVSKHAKIENTEDYKIND